MHELWRLVTQLRRDKYEPKYAPQLKWLKWLKIKFCSGVRLEAYFVAPPGIYDELVIESIEFIRPFSVRTYHDHNIPAECDNRQSATGGGPKPNCIPAADFPERYWNGVCRCRVHVR